MAIFKGYSGAAVGDSGVSGATAWRVARWTSLGGSAGRMKINFHSGRSLPWGRPVRAGEGGGELDEGDAEGGPEGGEPGGHPQHVRHQET